MRGRGPLWGNGESRPVRVECCDGHRVVAKPDNWSSRGASEGTVGPSLCALCIPGHREESLPGEGPHRDGLSSHPVRNPGATGPLGGKSLPLTDGPPSRTHLGGAPSGRAQSSKREPVPCPRPRTDPVLGVVVAPRARCPLSELGVVRLIP